MTRKGSFFKKISWFKNDYRNKRKKPALNGIKAGFI